MSTRYLPDDWTLPALTEENRAFFTSGEIRVQRCTSCSTVQHPPGEVCHNCQAMEFDYIASRPIGVIESCTVVHHAVHPMLRQKLPYNVVVVALDEHPEVHIVGNVVDAEVDEVQIGLPVTATFAEITNEEGETIRLPQWRLLRS